MGGGAGEEEAQKSGGEGAEKPAEGAEPGKESRGD